MGITITLLVLAIFVIIYAALGFKIIQQSETMVIERLGRFHRILPSGINIIWPIIDKPREIKWRFVKQGYDKKNILVVTSVDKLDLRETVFDFPKQNVITKDNVVTEINAILFFQITDPMKAVYEISNLPDAIEKLTQTTLRNVIGEMDLDETLTSRDTINQKLREVLDDATHKWGVKVNRVELQDINPPLDIRDAMEKQMRAERDKRAKILEAEGTKAKMILESEGFRMANINKAEGEKQAQILAAEGQAESRVKVAAAEAEAITKVTQAIQLTKSDPINYIIAVKYIDTLKEMVSGQNNKIVYMPFEATGVLSSIGGIKDLFLNQPGGKA